MALPKTFDDWVQHRVTRHVLLALILISIAVAVSAGAEGLAGGWARDAANELIPPHRKALCHAVPPGAVDKATMEAVLPGLSGYAAASDSEKARIAGQAAKAQRLECLHLALIERYVTNYYIAVLMSMVFGGLAAVALFLVGPKGWTQSNEYLVNVLIVAGAIAAFYGAFPTIFQQPAMTAAHKTQLLRYEALLDGMASHVASPNIVPLACLTSLAPSPQPQPPARVRDTPYPVAEFIACTDTALAAADIPFTLDPAGGPDYQKIFGGTPK